MNSKPSIAACALLASCMLSAGTVCAQSHSVTNMANPPQDKAASGPAAEATPERSGHQKKTARPNGKTKKPVKKARSKEVGAQADMQHKPSEHTVNDSEQRAFDKPAAH